MEIEKQIQIGAGWVKECDIVCVYHIPNEGRMENMWECYFANDLILEDDVAVSFTNDVITFTFVLKGVKYSRLYEFLHNEIQDTIRVHEDILLDSLRDLKSVIDRLDKLNNERRSI